MTSADKKINSLLVECIAERQAFLDDFTRLYADYGLSLIVSNELFCPGIWNGAEIRDLRLKLGLDVSITPVSPSTAAQSAIVEPSGSESPPDPNIMASEAESSLETPIYDVLAPSGGLEACDCFVDGSCTALDEVLTPQEPLADEEIWS